MIEEQIERVRPSSPDITAASIENLKALFPEAVTEGRIDFERLRQALGDAVDTGPERYGLGWAGRAEAIRTVQTPIIATLMPDRQESVEFDTSKNLFIEGDNLEVLKLLQDAYHGQVKMIYIDPPYNTGNDFVYPDNFRDPLGNYERLTGQRDDDGNRLTANAETGGRYHSRWLSMMYPRLYYARQLLREDGVIFVSVDDNEVHNLRLLMNDVFGEENFIGQIVVQLNPRGRHLDRFVARTHEYLMVYARDESQQVTYQLEKDETMTREYTKEDERGRYRELELRNRNPAFNRRTRPNLYYPIYVSPEFCTVALEPDEEHVVEVYPKNSSGQDSCWTWGKDKFNDDYRLLVARQTTNDGWRIFRKDYLIREDGSIATTMPKALWLDSEMNNDYGRKAVQQLFGDNMFDFPKAPGLITRALRVGTRPTDLVFDFFAGSCTTAQAVLDLNREDGGNRRFIMVQLPEPTSNPQLPTIADIGRERIRRVIQKMNTEQNGKLPLDEREAPEDLGFRAFRLAESNFEAWDGAIAAGDEARLKDQIAMRVEHVRAGRTREDLLYEVMLRCGVPLTAALEEREAAGVPYYAVADGVLFACVADEVSAEAMRAMIEEGPQQIVCLDSAFDSNDQVKTNMWLEARDRGVQFRTI